MPVIVLTPRGMWHETVQGIDAGADDCVAKIETVRGLGYRLGADR
jgi:DNA-binding response OmpR family regulator